MLHTSTRRVRGIAALAVLPVAAIVLSACAPTPTSGPSSVACTASIGSSGNSAYSYAVERCHLKYASYMLDTANGYAQQRAAEIAAVLTAAQCSNGGLGAYHVSTSWLQFVYGGYGGAGVQVGENLYCSWNSSGACPLSTDGATKAMNAWIKSAGHKANLDKFRGKSVNGGGACVIGRGVFVGLAHFHNP